MIFRRETQAGLRLTAESTADQHAVEIVALAIGRCAVTRKRDEHCEDDHALLSVQQDGEA